MRNYKQKMDKFRLPKERYKELRAICLSKDPRSKELISAAIMVLTENLERPDALVGWIYKHVTSDRYPWARLEAERIPCSRDTFRLYRAMFYYTLDQIINETGRHHE